VAGPARPRALLLVLSLALAGLPGAALAEEAVLRLVVNGTPRGDGIVAIDADGDVWLEQETLAALDFGVLPEGARVADGRVSLRSLAPALRFELDVPSATLRLRIDPERLAGSRVDLSRPAPPGLRLLEQDSALLNYSLRLDLLEERTLALPFELGLRRGPALLFSDFDFSSADDAGFVRLSTRAVLDDLARLRRLTLGDLVARSDTDLGSQLLLGGVSLARDFRLQPYLVRRPAPDVSGVLETASEVEVYVDGQLLSREDLPAGRFELADLPVRQGAGEVRLVIRDAFGRTREVDSGIYAASRLLRAGLSEYALQLGFERESFGRRSFDYGEPMALGFYRRGLRDWLSAGFHGEGSTGLLNVGGSLDVLAGRVGELGLSLAGSTSDAGSGAALAARYLRTGWRGSAGLLLRGASERYAIVAGGGGAGRARFDALASVGLSLGRIGVSAQASYAGRRGLPHRVRVGLGLRRRIGTRLFASVSVGATRDGSHTVARADLGLTLQLGTRQTGSLLASHVDGRSSARLSLDRHTPFGPGVDYRVDLASLPTGVHGNDFFGDGFFEWRSDDGIASTRYQHRPGSDRAQLGWAGGVVAAGGRVRATRPVDDAFLLVEVPGLPGVAVSHNNHRVAVTDDAGVAVLPELDSYLYNEVAIDPGPLPIGRYVRATRRPVTTPLRGGALLDFPVEELRAYEGRVLFRTPQGRVPAQFARLELEVAGRHVRTALGTGGALYLEDLPPGRYPARVRSRRAACRFELELPESDELFHDLGDIVCEATPEPAAARRSRPPDDRVEPRFPGSAPDG
jgi:outer membrane usher protein